MANMNRNTISEETRTAVSKSAFSLRVVYYRFLKYQTGMNERTFYRMMTGAPASEENLAALELAVDENIREPLIVLKRIDKSIRSHRPIVLSPEELSTLLPLLSALE